MRFIPKSELKFREDGLLILKSSDGAYTRYYDAFELKTNDNKLTKKVSGCEDLGEYYKK